MNLPAGLVLIFVSVCVLNLRLTTSHELIYYADSLDRMDGAVSYCTGRQEFFTGGFVYTSSSSADAWLDPRYFSFTG